MAFNQGGCTWKHGSILQCLVKELSNFLSERNFYVHENHSFRNIVRWGEFGRGLSSFQKKKKKKKKFQE